MKNIPSNLYPKVLALINETYVDKMDSIESAQVNEDGIIEAIAIDEGSKFVCRYADGAIEIKALSPDEQTKTVGFAAGKPRNCKAGISCGGSCISKSKTCKKKGTGGQAEKAKEITALVWQPGKGSPKDAPAKASKSTAPKKESTEKKERKPTAKAIEKQKKAIEDAKDNAIMQKRGKANEALRDRIESIKNAGDHTKMSAEDLTTTLLDTDGEAQLTLLGITNKYYMPKSTLPKDMLRSMSKKLHPDVNKDPRAGKAFAALKDLVGGMA
jgi:hypothetical protein